MTQKIYIQAAIVIMLITNLHAKQWDIDYDKSYIHFKGEHAGIEFKGEFPVFKADIIFDPNELDKAKITATIDVSKAIVTDKLYTETLKTIDWFNSTAIPMAYFSSDNIASIESDLYTIDGYLKIKNIKKKITLSANINITDKKALVEAHTTIQRNNYEIGSTSDKDGEWVSLDIPVTLYIVASEKQ